MAEILFDWLSLATLAMNPNEAAIFCNRENTQAFDETIGEDSQALGSQLQVLRERLFPPEAKKELRSFSTAETAKLIGVTEKLYQKPCHRRRGSHPLKRRTMAGAATLLGRSTNCASNLTKGKTSYVPWRKGW